ncbi:MAG: thiamine diphosphokinase [Acidimicrobiia bacterium]
MRTLILFAGGESPPRDVLEDLPEAELVVAADGGYDIAVELGHPVDVLVGDLDSIHAAELPGHVLVERHPVDKDATDLELALELMSMQAPDRVVIVGGSGGRIDHEFGAAALICSPRWVGIEEIDWFSARGRAHVIRGHRRLHGDIGATVSLIASGGDATGVRTTGLHWDLAGEDLQFGSTRGLSNRLVSPVVDISVESGCLLALFPRL